MTVKLEMISKYPVEECARLARSASRSAGYRR